MHTSVFTVSSAAKFGTNTIFLNWIRSQQDWTWKVTQKLQWTILNIFAQESFLVRKDWKSSRWFEGILILVALILVALLSVALILVAFWSKFLPYHSTSTTWDQIWHTPKWNETDKTFWHCYTSISTCQPTELPNIVRAVVRQKHKPKHKLVSILTYKQGWKPCQIHKAGTRSMSCCERGTKGCWVRRVFPVFWRGHPLPPCTASLFNTTNSV